MCGNWGYVRLKGGFEHFPQFKEYLKSVADNLVQRGPDCFGMWGQWAPLGSDSNAKAVGWYQKDTLSKYKKWQETFANFFQRDTKKIPHMVLANFRGIPTTEYFNELGELGIQPYFSPLKDLVVTHNGQLANDQELSKKYPYSNPPIDSYHFVNVLDAANSESKYAELLHEIEGSYSFIGYNKNTNNLHFARSYRGLYFAVWRRKTIKFIEDKHNLVEGEEDHIVTEDWYLVWASEREALESRTQSFYQGTSEVDFAIVEMPLYSMMTLDTTPSKLAQLVEAYKTPYMFADWLLTKKIVTFSQAIKENKFRSKHNMQSCAVVFSGGMDSTVCATQACKDYKEVHLLHFRYGARAEGPEETSVRNIAKWLQSHNENVKIVLSFIDLDFLKKLGGSTLTDHTQEIANGELGIETTHEWVPARNISMIGLATSYCDRHDIGAIILGLNMDEGSIFEDNSIEFYRRMEDALAIGSHSRPKMVMPLGNSMKHHIWKMGRDMNAPLHLSWSCYTDGMPSGFVIAVSNGNGKTYSDTPIRCGTCGPCIMRQRAAAMNGEQDPIEYQERDPVSEKILNIELEKRQKIEQKLRSVEDVNVTDEEGMLLEFLYELPEHTYHMQMSPEFAMMKADGVDLEQNAREVFQTLHDKGLAEFTNENNNPKIVLTSKAIKYVEAKRA